MGLDLYYIDKQTHLEEEVFCFLTFANNWQVNIKTMKSGLSKFVLWKLFYLFSTYFEISILQSHSNIYK